VPKNSPIVIGGVDCHKRTHKAVLLTEQRGRMTDKEFLANQGGYRDIVEWMCAHSQLARFGVDSTRSYDAGLCRHLRERGINVVDVNRPY